MVNTSLCYLLVNTHVSHGTEKYKLHEVTKSNVSHSSPKYKSFYPLKLGKFVVCCSCVCVQSILFNVGCKRAVNHGS